MKILITGGCKNGKSDLAQKLACALAGDRRQAAPLYYVATMIPRDEEDRARIERHRENRAGLGFTTLEWGSSLSLHLAQADRGGTYLLDSLTALLANEMFRHDEAGHWFSDRKAAGRIMRDLTALGTRVRNIIVVSDGIYSDAVSYDSETVKYRASLAGLERRIAEGADTVIECCAGVPVLRRGKKDFFDGFADSRIRKAGETGKDSVNDERFCIEEVIVGGSCQGKSAYLQSKYGLTREELCDLRAAGQPDFNCTGFLHLEAYLRRCTEQGIGPVSPDLFPKGSVVVCDDIFCGIVPADPVDRAWRENLGRYLTALSGRARHVTRLICGIPEVLR